MLVEARHRYLRAHLGDAFRAAADALKTEGSCDLLLELYDHGLLCSLEVLNETWGAFHDNPSQRESLGVRLRQHKDAAIQNIPADWNELERQRHQG